MTFAVSYSTVCPQALLTHLAVRYNILDASACDFWFRGLNDTYKITAVSGDLALRVYRHRWGTFADIGFEMDALSWLERAGAHVAAPVQDIDGHFISSILAPEGERHIVLSTFVGGRVLSYEAEDDAVAYGRAVANLHELSAGFQSHHARSPLDAEQLIHQPLAQVEALFVGRPDDWAFMRAFAARLAEHFADAWAAGIDQGFCHGDCHGFNAHAWDGDIVHFDFDCCGVGPRLYDLATFKWSARLRKQEQQWWPAFLQGYRSRRPLADADLAHVEAFVAIRDLWLFGLHAANGGDLGKGWMNEPWLERRLAFLREAEQRMQC